MKPITILLTLLSIGIHAQPEHSVARKWNEVLLEAIRNDFARPTVHARNLFHVSAAMYDGYVQFDDTAVPYLLGNDVNGFRSMFDGFVPVSTSQEAIEEAISYAAYRLITHRFINSPGAFETLTNANELMAELGYDVNFTSRNYSTGNPAALGNYIAQQYINYGLQDGSNEVNDYANQYYFPENDPLYPKEPGNSNITYPNAWQPLGFDTFIDQSGNVIPGEVPDFLSPEWGNVLPFALQETDRKVLSKNGDEYTIYADPGPPPMLGASPADDEQYRWGFSLVLLWSEHLDPTQGDSLDISPASLGNLDISSFPDDFNDYPAFYDYLWGGDPSNGHALNPFTGEPYPEQRVAMGDYARILAEFWADGPDSETPPGHWFTILNTVNDHPQLIKRFQGAGELISDLEWDIRSYFTLGGAMHDVAISVWGLKGYYDYVRPISAIRYMGDLGQSSDENQPSFHPHGLPLIEDRIELVKEGDPLAGGDGQHINKIKVRAWRGPDYIDDPAVDVAGVDWILVENWWPYQRPTFVTPNFAGYVSGHSTYSRAAAEVLTALTGDPFFPGGIGEFNAPKNEFLVFENGPSEDIVLQWATYRDAADQCSLSRIWGGIHPPADDLPGRILGERIGKEAFNKAILYFSGRILETPEEKNILFYPNPASDMVFIHATEPIIEVSIYSLNGHLIKNLQIGNLNAIDLSSMDRGKYLLKIITRNEVEVKPLILR